MKPHKPQNLTDKWKLDKLFDLLQVRGFVVFLNHCLHKRKQHYQVLYLMFYFFTSSYLLFDSIPIYRTVILQQHRLEQIVGLIFSDWFCFLECITIHFFWFFFFCIVLQNHVTNLRVEIFMYKGEKK